MWTCLALLAPSTASAQEAPEVALEDDASVAPVIEKLGAMLEQLEAKGVQVTDLHLGRVKDDGVGVKVELAPLSAGSSMVVAGLGDDRRIVDLDLAVTDLQNGRWTDQLSDNNPVVQFDSADGGAFTANVLITESLPGATDGFYLLVAGFLSEPSLVVSASAMVEVLQLAAGLGESMALRFVDGGMAVMTAGQNASIDLMLPANSGSTCFVMAFGDPGRTKKLALAVNDRSGNVVGTAKGKGLLTAPVMPGAAATQYRVVLTPKLAGGLGDSHAMALVACQ